MAQPLTEDLETVERVLGLIGDKVTVAVQPGDRFLSGQTFTIMLDVNGTLGVGQGGTFAGALQDLHAAAEPALEGAF